ncbi:hypothetical protein PSYPI_42740, partial [Pseudomonas syringae pv. pisi str. 1704B]
DLYAPPDALRTLGEENEGKAYFSRVSLMTVSDQRGGTGSSPIVAHHL